MRNVFVRYAVLVGAVGALVLASSCLRAETIKREVIDGASGLSANIPTVTSNAHTGWKIGLILGRVNFETDVASAEGVDNSANSFGVTGQYYFRPQAYVAVGIEAIVLDDNNSFTQLAENPVTDEIERLESTAWTIPLEVEAGYNFTFDVGKPLMLGVNSGYSQVLSSERDIDNCTDCEQEDIDIDGGLYAGLLFGLEFNQELSAQVRLRNYIAGDIKNSIGIGVHWAR